MYNKQDLRFLCVQKRVELINKHFGNLVQEAAHEMPEKLDEKKYPLDLSKTIEQEYFDFFNELLVKYQLGASKPLKDILDKHELILSATRNYRKSIESAYDDAKAVTLWEKLTKSNHEDVTFYKGLLKAYTEELLKWDESDFMEEMCI